MYIRFESWACWPSAVIHSLFSLAALSSLLANQRQSKKKIKSDVFISERESTSVSTEGSVACRASSPRTSARGAFTRGGCAEVTAVWTAMLGTGAVAITEAAVRVYRNHAQRGPPVLLAPTCSRRRESTSGLAPWFKASHKVAAKAVRRPEWEGLRNPCLGSSPADVARWGWLAAGRPVPPSRDLLKGRL